MTTPAYDRILAALYDHGVDIKERGDQARAQCPAHDSSGLTLSVRRGEDRAKLHCFAGCPDTDVLAAIGLGVRDLFDGPPAPGYVPPPRRILNPWETALAELGIHDGPSFEHLMHRIMVEQAKEDAAGGDAA